MESGIEKDKRGLKPFISMANPSKIIFSGLDEAGKTSIILTLQNNFSGLNCLKPTLGMERTTSTIKFLGLELITWDLGGQSSYRAEYFKQKSRVFSQVSTMFYVVDVTTPKRFDESIEYLDNILKTFDELKIDPAILILINKLDPDRSTDPKLIKNGEEFKEKAEKIKGNFKMYYYYTSIHDSPTIIRAFSDGVIRRSPKTELIGNILRNFAKMTFSSLITLLDESSLIIGTHYTKEEYLEMCEIIAPRFAKSIDSLSRYNVKSDYVLVDVTFPSKGAENGNQKAQIYIRKFNLDEDSFYIVVLSLNPRTVKLVTESLPDLSFQLTELIRQFKTE